MNAQAMQRLHELERSDRVRAHTPATVNARIDRTALASVEEAAHEGRDGLVRRLAELDREWDVDRALMANFAILGGLSYVLGERASREWTWLFRAQLGFLLLHAVAGWCPPAAAFRRLGFRTVREIEVERQEAARRLASHASPFGVAEGRSVR